MNQTLCFVLQEFQRDADELLLWMEEKFKIAEDESYRDPTNILQKLKRHEAAEKEMQANQVWLDRLVQVNSSYCLELEISVSPMFRVCVILRFREGY